MSPEIRTTFSVPLVRRNIVVAAVVGTVLVAINQGDVIVADGRIDLVKAVLTYCVPFLVASYGSYNSLRAMARAAANENSSVKG